MLKILLAIIAFLFLSPQAMGEESDKNFKLASFVLPPVMGVNEIYGEYFITRHLALGASWFSGKYDPRSRLSFFIRHPVDGEYHSYGVLGKGGHLKYYFPFWEGNLYLKAGYSRWTVKLEIIVPDYYTHHYIGKSSTVKDKNIRGSSTFDRPDFEAGYSVNVGDSLIFDFGYRLIKTEEIRLEEDEDGKDGDKINKIFNPAGGFQARIGFMF